MSLVELLHRCYNFLQIEPRLLNWPSRLTARPALEVAAAGTGDSAPSSSIPAGGGGASFAARANGEEVVKSPLPPD
jgi:hypothetical protein